MDSVLNQNFVKQNMEIIRLVFNSKMGLTAANSMTRMTSKIDALNKYIKFMSLQRKTKCFTTYFNKVV